MNTKDSIEKLFQQFASKKVCIVGDMMLDQYVHGIVERISPEAPVPVVSVLSKESRAGGAANVAMNIKAMEAEPFLISVYGNDIAGITLLEILEKKQISTAYLIQSASRCTTSKTRILSKQNQLVRIDEETSEYIEKEIEDQLYLNVKNCIEKEKPEVLIFEDYNKGVLTEKLIREITMLCLQNKIPIAVDPKKNNFFAYQLCTLFKPNLRELQESLQVPIDLNDLQTMDKATSELHKKLHHGISLVTLSEKGIYLKSADKSFVLPAQLRSVSDVSGAGDTVISIAALCIAAKTSLEIIAEISNIAGGIVCEFPGVVPIDKKRLMEETIHLLVK